MTKNEPSVRISGLDELIRAAAKTGNAPVDRWNPPDCGDIGLAIAADGTWTYRGSPIGRMPLVRLFARVLRRDENGQTFLVTPAEKIDIAVADAPFVAGEMEVRGAGCDQQLIFRTNVDDIVVANAEHTLRFVTSSRGGIKPYIRVRGRLDALITRSITYDLLDLALATDPERPAVWSGGVRFELPI